MEFKRNKHALKKYIHLPSSWTRDDHINGVVGTAEFYGGKGNRNANGSQDDCSTTEQVEENRNSTERSDFTPPVETINSPVDVCHTDSSLPEVSRTSGFSTKNAEPIADSDITPNSMDTFKDKYECRNRATTRRRRSPTTRGKDTGSDRYCNLQRKFTVPNSDAYEASGEESEMTVDMNRAGDWKHRKPDKRDLHEKERRPKEIESDGKFSKQHAIIQQSQKKNFASPLLNSKDSERAAELGNGNTYTSMISYNKMTRWPVEYVDDGKSKNKEKPVSIPFPWEREDNIQGTSVELCRQTFPRDSNPFSSLSAGKSGNENFACSREVPAASLGKSYISNRKCQSYKNSDISPALQRDTGFILRNEKPVKCSEKRSQTPLPFSVIKSDQMHMSNDDSDRNMSHKDISYERGNANLSTQKRYISAKPAYYTKLGSPCREVNRRSDLGSDSLPSSYALTDRKELHEITGKTTRDHRIQGRSSNESYNSDVTYSGRIDSSADYGSTYLPLRRKKRKRMKNRDTEKHRYNETNAKGAKHVEDLHWLTEKALSNYKKDISKIRSIMQDKDDCIHSLSEHKDVLRRILKGVSCLDSARSLEENAKDGHLTYMLDNYEPSDNAMRARILKSIKDHRINLFNNEVDAKKDIVSTAVKVRKSSPRRHPKIQSCDMPDDAKNNVKQMSYKQHGIFDDCNRCLICDGGDIEFNSKESFESYHQKPNSIQNERLEKSTTSRNNVQQYQYHVVENASQKTFPSDSQADVVQAWDNHIELRPLDLRNCHYCYNTNDGTNENFISDETNYAKMKNVSPDKRKEKDKVLKSRSDKRVKITNSRHKIKKKSKSEKNSSTKSNKSADSGILGRLWETRKIFKPVFASSQRTCSTLEGIISSSSSDSTTKRLTSNKKEEKNGYKESLQKECSRQDQVRILENNSSKNKNLHQTQTDSLRRHNGKRYADDFEHEKILMPPSAPIRHSSNVNIYFSPRKTCPMNRSLESKCLYCCDNIAGGKSPLTCLHSFFDQFDSSYDDIESYELYKNGKQQYEETYDEAKENKLFDVNVMSYEDKSRPKVEDAVNIHKDTENRNQKEPKSHRRRKRKVKSTCSNEESINRQSFQVKSKTPEIRKRLGEIEKHVYKEDKLDSTDLNGDVQSTENPNCDRNNYDDLRIQNNVLLDSSIQLMPAFVPSHSSPPRTKKRRKKREKYLPPTILTQENEVDTKNEQSSNTIFSESQEIDEFFAPIKDKGHNLLKGHRNKESISPKSSSKIRQIVMDESNRRQIPLVKEEDLKTIQGRHDIMTCDHRESHTVNLNESIEKLFAALDDAEKQLKQSEDYMMLQHRNGNFSRLSGNVKDFMPTDVSLQNEGEVKELLNNDSQLFLADSKNSRPKEVYRERNGNGTYIIPTHADNRFPVTKSRGQVLNSITAMKNGHLKTSKNQYEQPSNIQKIQTTDETDENSLKDSSDKSPSINDYPLHTKIDDRKKNKTRKKKQRINQKQDPDNNVPNKSVKTSRNGKTLENVGIHCNGELSSTLLCCNLKSETEHISPYILTNTNIVSSTEQPIKDSPIQCEFHERKSCNKTRVKCKNIENLHEEQADYARKQLPQSFNIVKRSDIGHRKVHSYENLNPNTEDKPWTRSMLEDFDLVRPLNPEHCIGKSVNSEDNTALLYDYSPHLLCFANKSEDYSQVSCNLGPGYIKAKGRKRAILNQEANILPEEDISTEYKDEVIDYPLPSQRKNDVIIYAVRGGQDATRSIGNLKEVNSKYTHNHAPIAEIYPWQLQEMNDFCEEYDEQGDSDRKVDIISKEDWSDENKKEEMRGISKSKDECKEKYSQDDTDNDNGGDCHGDDTSLDISSTSSSNSEQETRTSESSFYDSDTEFDPESPLECDYTRDTAHFRSFYNVGRSKRSTVDVDADGMALAKEISFASPKYRNRGYSTDNNTMQITAMEPYNSAGSRCAMMDSKWNCDDDCDDRRNGRDESRNEDDDDEDEDEDDDEHEEDDDDDDDDDDDVDDGNGENEKSDIENISLSGNESSKEDTDEVNEENEEGDETGVNEDGGHSGDGDDVKYEFIDDDDDGDGASDESSEEQDDTSDEKEYEYIKVS